MQPKPIDPIDAWNALVDFAEGAELDRLDALSPEELEAELVAAGYSDKGATVSTPGADASTVGAVVGVKGEDKKA